MMLIQKRQTNADKREDFYCLKHYVTGLLQDAQGVNSIVMLRLVEKELI